MLLVFMFDRIGRIDDETPFVVEWFVHHGINAKLDLYATFCECANRLRVKNTQIVSLIDTDESNQAY